MPELKDGLPVKRFTTQNAFETWMTKNHEKAPGIWIKYAKKASGLKSVTYAEALDVALCFGWIDGKAWSLDETFYLQRYTPRRTRSPWSNLNRGHVARLQKEGRMRPAGLREVERAKANGRWENSYMSPKDAKVPPDLERALKKTRNAWDFFESLSASNRYAILFQIHDAKKPETRARRIEKFVKMCADGQKPY